MILEELELVNFRSHKNTKLRFDEGITVVVGDNGSGKTSILEAVGFALFRESPSRVKIEELVRRGREKEGMRVSLVFSAGGRKYKILRSYNGGKSSSLLYDEQGRLISTGEKNKQTTREIENKVRMDAKLFTNAIYIRQGQIDALLTAEARERKELIGRLIGTYELEKAFVNMRVIISEYEIRCQTYKDIPREIEELEGKIEENEKEIQRLQGIIAGLRGELKEKVAEREAKEKEAEILEKAINLVKEIKLREQELNENKRRLAEISENEEILRITENSKNKYEELGKEIEKLKGRITLLQESRRGLERLRKELDDAEQKILQLRAHLEDGLKKGSSLLGIEIQDPEVLDIELSKEKSRLEEDAERIERTILDVERVIGELKGKNKEVQETLKEVLGAEEKCPVCRRPLSRDHRERLVKEYNGIIHNNRNLIKEAELKKERLEEKKQLVLKQIQKISEINVEVIKNAARELRSAEAKSEKLKEEIRQWGREIEGLTELEKTLKELRSAQDSLRKDYERYIAAIGFLRRIAPEKDSIKKRRDELVEIISDLKKELTATKITPDERKLASLRGNIKELYQAINSLSSMKSAREAEVGERKKTVQEYNKRLQKLRRKKAEGEKLERFLQLLKKIRALFHKDNLQRKLRSQAKPLIERYTREEFQKFHLPYSDVSLTDDFEVTLYGPNGGVRMDMLSGGERIAAALALRIGIAKALAGSAMELLMLDEPTIHLDATRRRELVEIIRNLTTLPQTIIVTHDKEFEEAADKLIEVEKVDGISRLKEG